MKTTTRFCTLVLCSAALLASAFATQAHAQEVKGAIQVEAAPEVLDSGNAIDLFKAFREGAHEIHFAFEGDPVAFVFFGTVRRDGEVIGAFEGSPQPYLPGDMLMCPEAFGFIGALGYERTPGRAFGQLAPGEYEVRLGARPQGARGEIEPAAFRFRVPER